MKIAAGSLKAAWLDDPLPYCAGALVFLSIMIGGGGAEGPLGNAILEGLGAVLLCAVAAAHFGGKRLAPQSVAPLWMTAAILLAILMQLIPLPPSVWPGLPGRETAAAVDMVVDGRLDWRPLSLDPEATRRSAAAILLPLPIMLIAIGATRRGLLFMVRALLSGALLSAMLGAGQLALGSPADLAPYGGPVPGAASGLFANSNHQAALMLAALVASGLLIRLDDPSLKIRTRKGSLRLHLGWIVIPIFSVMTIAAMSRAGWALLIPALAASLLIATGWRRTALVLVTLLIGLAAAAGAAVTAGLATGDAGSLQALLQDNRLISLPDILYTLQQFWPVGSGLGTFVPAFMANENLDLVSNVYLNHAHNDLLELIIEMGVFGVVLAAVAAMLLVYRLWIVFKGRSSSEVTAALGGASLLALLLLHSLVDYPLRNDAIAAVTGFAIGLMLARAERRSGESRPEDRSRRPTRGFARSRSSAQAGF